jgi:uncharacterized protein YabE (DUF348 family)
VLRQLDGDASAFSPGVDTIAGARVLDLVSFDYTPAPRSKSVFRGFFRLALTVGVAAGCAMYLQAQKQITVVDRGVTRTLRTFAPTVGDALSRASIEVGTGDRIVPSAEVPLAPDHKIEVLRAKDVVMVINGERQVHRATGKTVAEVLKELSVVSRGALIAPAPGTPVGPGDEVVVAQSVQTTVIHDGKTQPVTTNVLTAGGLLRQLGVVLGPHDRVEPNILAYPSEGSTIKVVRVNQALETLHSKIDFKTQTEPTDKLELGIRKVKHPGVEGVKAARYRILYEDGKVKSRTFIGSEVVRQPTNQITLVGTFRPVLKAANSSQAGKASWYTQPGLMAAHRYLPFGTVVRVTNLSNGRHVTVTIRDRGPYVDGRVIDLSDTAFNQLSPTSSGVLNVKIEW